MMMNLELLRSKLNIHRLFIAGATNRKTKEKEIEVFKSFNGELYEIRNVELIKQEDGKYYIVIK